ncbi:hypothetical protein F5880DRAFT_1617725 [Lentinula raphanica]|nr:hypothetical protein F5880DRAFT_1617725 [Lentinula raphanica]
MRTQYQLLYVFLVITSTLIVSLLDVLKRTYAASIGIYIDIAVLSWLPLSFFGAMRVLRGCMGEVPVGSLPLRRMDQIRLDQVSLGQPEDFTILLGFGHTWLMFNRLSYVILYQSSDSALNSTIPSPLLFTFCHGPGAILVSLLFTIIFFGICLQSCGISQPRWGYFLYVYLMVTVPMTRLTTLFRWSIALLEGRIGIVD